MNQKQLDAQSQLDKLAQALIDNNPAPELEFTATQLVFGSGNPQADIMFIGEAPGKHEDESGMPFVGAAGKFLNEMLASIDLSRQDIYITNIVKYRPPNNRDPLPVEKAAFWPYLLKQIFIIKPKVVVTLGRHSGQAFLPDLRIGADHGKSKVRSVIITDKQQELVILPLYHPAAALYNGGLRTTLIKDFQQLKQCI